MKIKFDQVKIHVTTKQKLVQVGAAKRWKLAVVVDEAVNALIEREGIRLPQPRTTTRQHAA